MDGVPEDSTATTTPRNDASISLRTAPIQVRRRRATISSRPASPPPGLAPVASDSPGLSAEASSSQTAIPEPLTNLATFPRATRRRGATITERLFSGDVYQGIGEDAGRTTRARAGTVVESNSRGRIGSVSSADSGGLRARLGLGSERASLAGSELHAEDEIDLLDVLDDSIATTAHLTNIQSAFFPSFLSRPPVCELPPATEGESLPLQDLTTQTDSKLLAEVKEEDEEEEDPLDAHLRKIVRKQKRDQKIKEGLKGVWAFLKTPLGIFFGIYGFLVVFWGAGLVFVLIIPFQDAYTKGLWIEIASQVLTALFTITGIGMFPSRLIDTYYIGVIYSLARRTRERRVKFGLSSLRDRNDLPDPEPVLPGGVVTSRANKGAMERSGELGEVERDVGTHCDGSKTEEIVLTEAEFARLHHAQMKFAASQTWYRPHESPTHHAFPISAALIITILTDLNSVFQALLCGVMWGIKGIPPNERPAWTTATFIVFSFGSGLAAAVMIGLKSEKSKKKKEVTRKVWAMLKADELIFETRRKEAVELKERERREKKERKEKEREGGLEKKSAKVGGV